MLLRISCETALLYQLIGGKVSPKRNRKNTRIASVADRASIVLAACGGRIKFMLPSLVNIG
jgi:hypothetical protein